MIQIKTASPNGAAIDLHQRAAFWPIYPDIVKPQAPRFCREKENQMFALAQGRQGQSPLQSLLAWCRAWLKGALNRISDAAPKRKSSAWRETYACLFLNCARWPGRGRRRRTFCSAGWLRLASIQQKLPALNRRHFAICNASAPCANLTGAVRGTSRMTRHYQHGSLIVRTRIRWRH